MVSRNILLQLFGVQVELHIPAVRAGTRLPDRRRLSEHPGLLIGPIPPPFAQDPCGDSGGKGAVA